jgi:hypothetical protein
MAPKEAVAFIKRELKRPPPGKEEIDKLIRALGDAKYEVRQRAMADLEGLGPAVVSSLKQALQSKFPAEARARIEKLLANAKQPKKGPYGELLRRLRVVQILEYIGTKEAYQLLRTLNPETADNLLHWEVQNALRRLDAQLIGAP